MKNAIILLTCILLSCAGTYAQVSINTDNGAPDNSAMLDVKSGTRGFLPPRLTQVQRDAIISPAEGLIVICTDCDPANQTALAIYVNGAWRLLTGYCITPVKPVAASHTATLTQIIWNWNAVSGAIGYRWNTTNDFITATDMGTTTSKTENGLTCNTSYTRYIWAYNNCGHSPALVTSKSTLEDPPSAPTAGVHVPGITQIVWNWSGVTGAIGYKWNTTNSYATATDMGAATTKTETGLTCNTAYTRYAWAYSACGNSTSVTLTQTTLLNPPSSPTSGTHVPLLTQIVWNWNTVAGAAGYKWNTTNDFGTAIDMGTATSKTETGLTCGTVYNRYAWAYNNCGTSTALTMNQSTSACPFVCGQTLTDTRDGKTYGTVQIGSQCWMTRNLNIGTKINGSGEQTNNSIIEKYCYLDAESYCDVYGGLYQWAEMVQYLNGATNTTSWNPVPTGNVQGICPAGWHLGKASEWQTLVNFLGNDYASGGPMKETGSTHWAEPNAGATNSSGFTGLPGGQRSNSVSFDYIHQQGEFWNSTESTPNIAGMRVLFYYLTQVGGSGYSKEHGLSVRCLKD